jgi:hypothetical protein
MIDVLDAALDALRSYDKDGDAGTPSSCEPNVEPTAPEHSV